MHVNYEDFIDEYDIWVEGRSDKIILDIAIDLLNKKEFIPFNIRFSNNFANDKESQNSKICNEIINGSIGVKTQFLSWLSKNNRIKKGHLTNEIKPKCFIFDNDLSGQEKFNSIKKLLEENKQKSFLNADSKSHINI